MWNADCEHKPVTSISFLNKMEANTILKYGYSNLVLLHFHSRVLEWYHTAAYANGDLHAAQKVSAITRWFTVKITTHTHGERETVNKY